MQSQCTRGPHDSVKAPVGLFGSYQVDLRQVPRCPILPGLLHSSLSYLLALARNLSLIFVSSLQLPHMLKMVEVSVSDSFLEGLMTPHSVESSGSANLKLLRVKGLQSDPFY